MLRRRIIPCLDVKEGRVVKGVRFKGHEVVGEVLELAGRYRDEGADELVFYDITASAEGRTVDRAWVTATAKLLDIPFCVAGGIRSVAQAQEVLNAGADKISVNSPALETPGLIDELARRFGSQCVVVGIDSLREAGDYFVYQYTGSETRMRSSRRRTLDWAREVQERGAGEIVLNCMDKDGTRSGYDLEQLGEVRSRVTIPLIASGGASKGADFEAAFRLGVDGGLAAGVFHRGELAIGDLKTELKRAGIEVRI